MRFLSLLAAFFLLEYPVWAKTWQVCPTCGIKTVREALEQARPYDTVLILGGTYAEGNLEVRKPVVLLGQNWPVLDGQNKCEILTVKASDVRVEGIRFRASGRTAIDDYAAIKVLNGKNVCIRGNKVEDCFFGIYLAGSENCRIEQNDIQGRPTNEQDCGNGIHCWKCRNITIEDNHSTGHRDGIYFEFVTESQIRRNHSERNIRYGLHFMFSNNDSYEDNRFDHNGCGVAVMYTRGVKMYRNTFDDNWGSSAYGLLLKDISDSEIRHNHFRRNTVGIHMEGSSRIPIEENEFADNGWALRIQASCDGNRLTRNNFTGNSFDVATNGDLVLNTFDGNYWDKYEGYDLNKDGVGDVPFHPIGMYAMIVEQMPFALMLYRSFMVTLLDKAEKVIPSISPEQLVDKHPVMRSVKF